MRYHRVVVLLNDEEHARVILEAGAVPLSAWFRLKAINSEPIPVEYLHMREQAAAVRAIEGGKKPCKHGLLFCKKCS